MNGWLVFFLEGTHAAYGHRSYTEETNRRADAANGDFGQDLMAMADKGDKI